MGGVAPGLWVWGNSCAFGQPIVLVRTYSSRRVTVVSTTGMLL